MNHYTIIYVNTQFENVGDALIVKELIELCSSRTNLWINTSVCPNHFYESLRINHSNTSIIKILFDFALRRFKIYWFLMPGGLYGEASTYRYLSFSIKTAIIAAVSLVGVRVCQVGISLENMGPRYASLLRKRSKFMHHIAVRDHLSLVLAKRLLIEVDSIIPDLSVNLLFPAHGHEFILRSNTIAFSFRTDKSVHSKEQVKRFVLRVCMKLDEDQKVVFISQVQRDIAFHEELHALIFEKLGVRARHAVTWRSLDSTIDEMHNCQFLFSNRLHALLLGAYCGVQPKAILSLPTDNKILGVFKEFQMDSAVFGFEDDENFDVHDYTEILAAKRCELALYFDDIYRAPL